MRDISGSREQKSSKLIKSTLNIFLRLHIFAYDAMLRAVWFCVGGRAAALQTVYFVSLAFLAECRRSTAAHLANLPAKNRPPASKL